MVQFLRFYLFNSQGSVDNLLRKSKYVYPSSRTMALGFIQSLTEMSSGQWAKAKPARKSDNLTAIYEIIVYKMRDPRRLTTLYTFTTCYGDSFTYFVL
jgi:hypothetical protein